MWLTRNCSSLPNELGSHLSSTPQSIFIFRAGLLDPVLDEIYSNAEVRFSTLPAAVVVQISNLLSRLRES